MPVSNKQARRGHYLVVLLWLLSTLAAFFYWLNSASVLFDPGQKLNQLDNTRLVSTILNTTGLENMALRRAVIHFSTDTCLCNKLTQIHKKQVDKQAETDQFTIFDLTLAADEASVIPSTPALLIVDDAGELMYFGPYASGLLCSKDNSMLDVVFNNYRQGVNSRLVLSGTRGCYCNH